MEFKYTTSFEGTICHASSIEGLRENQFLNASIASITSIDSLKKIIPDSVCLDKNIDLLGVAFNAAVINVFNKNGEGIDAASAKLIKDFFKHKPTNVEHKKTRIVGHIVNAGFSKYGSNELLSEEQISDDTKELFNLCLAAVIYKTVDKDFAEALIQSNNPTSSFYKKISASWEIGYNDYDLAIGSIDLSACEIVSDKEKISKLEAYLKKSGGDGFLPDGRPIFKLIKGNIYPLGIGFTVNPAAYVQGVVIDDGHNPFVSDTSNVVKEDENEEEDEEGEEKISQDSSDSVNNNNKLMDLQKLIEQLKAILADKQKDVSFSEESIASISEKIAESIKEKNKELESKLTEAEIAKAKAVEVVEKLRSDLDSTTEKLSKLEAIVSSKAAAEIFNSRMAVLDADYEFDDSDRAILAKDLNKLDHSDESFASFKQTVATLFRHKNKEYIKEQNRLMQEKIDKAVAEKISQASTTSVEGKEKDVTEALKSAKASDSDTVGDKINLSWKEKVNKEFSSKNITVKY